MEHDKPVNEYSKSYSGENKFNHSRQRGNNFVHRGRGSREAIRGMGRDGINIRGAASNFRPFNHQYTMPPPGGNFASFGKSNPANVMDYGTVFSSMRPVDDNFTSLSVDRHDIKFASRGLPNLSQTNFENEKLVQKQDSSSAVAFSSLTKNSDGKGGFGRGRRGPPVTMRPVAITVSEVSPAASAAPAIDSSVVPKVDSAPAPKEHRSKPRSRHPSVQIDKIAENAAKTADFKINHNDNMTDLEFKKRLSFGDYEVEISAKDGSKYTDSILRTWNETGLSVDMRNHITKKLKYDKPTTIQSVVIPLLTRYLDVIFQSVTGSGKLTAIVLSVLDSLKKDAVGKSAKDISDVLQPRCLIISPTSKVMKDAHKLCLQLVGDLNFSVLRTFSESETSDGKCHECDILCSNLEDLNRYLKGSKISFDKLIVIAIEQAERIEQNSLNLIRFIRQAAVSKNPRQTIITGTFISSHVYELAAYIVKDNFFYVRHHKVQNCDQPHRYTKEDLMKMCEAFGDKKQDINPPVDKQNPVEKSSEPNEEFTKKNGKTDSKNKEENISDIADDDKSNTKDDKSVNPTVPIDNVSIQMDQSQIVCLTETEPDSGASQALDVTEENSSVTVSQDSDVPEEKHAPLEDTCVKLSNLAKTDFQSQSPSTATEASVLADNAATTEETLHQQLRNDSPASGEVMVASSLMGVSHNNLLALNSKMGGSLGSSCKTTSSSGLNCSNADLESIFRDMRKQIELETLKTKNELLQADNTRLAKRVVSLEQQLGSVMKFFGNFLASNVNESGTMGDTMLKRYGDLDRY